MSHLSVRTRELAPSTSSVLARNLAPALFWMVTALVLNFLVQPLVGPFQSKLIMDIGINVILAVSLTIVNGFTGQFSIGHAGFMAVGGYVAGAITYYGSYLRWRTADAHTGFLSVSIIDSDLELEPNKFFLVAVSIGVSLLFALAAYVVPKRYDRFPAWARVGLWTLAGVALLVAGVELAPRFLAAARLSLGLHGENGTLAWGDVLFIFSCVVGGCVAALLGYLVGLPSLRLKGDYLAIVTLGFGEIVRVLLQNTGPRLREADEIVATPYPRLLTHLGGALGFTNLPFYTSLFWVFIAVGITLVVAFRLKRSSHGRAFLSVREDEVAAEAMGINTTRFKVRAFVIAAFFAGVAGALYAHQVGSINAGDLGFQKSFDIVIMVVLGGMGSISGAVLAATILSLLPEILRQPPHVWPYGICLAIVVAILARHRLRAVILTAVATGVIELIRFLAGYFGVDLSNYRMIIYALLLILMMILRPQGLFGIQEAWDIRFGRAEKEAEHS